MNYEIFIFLKSFVPGKMFMIFSLLLLVEFFVHKLLKIKHTLTQSVVNLTTHYIGLRFVEYGVQRIALPTAGVIYDFGYIWDQYPVLCLIFFVLQSEFNIYIFHRLTHYHPLLWSLHEAHHSSSELNLSTAVRQPWFARILHRFTDWPFTFVLLAFGFKTQSLMIAGQFYILLYQAITHSGWSYENRYLSKIFILPSDHSKHHEVIPVGGRSYNFGNVLSIYDHLFGTYSKLPNKKIYGSVINYSESNLLAIQFMPLVNAYRLLMDTPTFMGKLRLFFLGRAQASNT